MPFANYSSFEECIKKIMAKKGFPRARAERYCGAIEHKVKKARKLKHGA